LSDSIKYETSNQQGAKVSLKCSNLIDEIEARAKAKIVWECCPDILGKMSAAIKDGVPTIQYRERSEYGTLEELMHLQLMYSGVYLSSDTNDKYVQQAMTMLQNIVHHHVIFPTLIDLGGEPSINECVGISKQLSQLEDSNDLERTSSDRKLEALMAIVYARGQLDCGNDDTMAKLSDIYSKSALSNARRLGEEIASLIQLQADLSSHACRKTLAECLKRLGLTEDIKFTILV